MKIPEAHPIRKVVREILAFAFWFHALYVLQIFPMGGLGFFSASSRFIYNSALVGFILYYSYLSDRGWISVAYDLFYIYFWPFVTAFRCMWLLSKYGYRFMKSHIIIRSPGLIVKQIPKIETKPGKLDSVTADVSETKPNETVKKKRFWRPLTQFDLLWSILILTIDNKIFICIVSAVALVGAAKAIYILWNLLADTSSWIDKLKSNFAGQMAKKISIVRQWHEGIDAENLTADVNVLKIYESAFTFIDENRDFLAKCTVAVAACITVPFYCYVSLLFSFVYFGIAKVESIPWNWPSALSASLYIPFAFTNLPHSFLIQLIAGLQAFAVTIMGWNIVFRNLSSRFEKIARAATELRSPFQESVYREKVQMVTRAASLSASAVPLTKTTESAQKPKTRKRRHGSTRKPKVAPHENRPA